MPSNDTIDWNACIVLRACEWLSERGRERHDGPRNVARTVEAWCAGKATKRDVIDALGTMQAHAETDDNAWYGIHYAAVKLTHMVLGHERAINAAVVRVQEAISWVFDPQRERCYATLALEEAQSLVGQWSRERDESKRPA
jgi:hypothetical protein